ncbi:VTT domain-containing protein [Clostridium sp. OS1-26]|uniref:VTT domain-containing protein n=1 Tax=Clostridium sp. OS1-26 TaxID=3070681 RepID=UPI0027DFC4FD|nr:VTT domain-containing protein [Clostridium sp. OS1-26]WML37516.1 VTT domain-containing protein [Clostridium sp. OS1-26]
MHNISLLFDQYGYIVLFAALMLELIAFPLPGEILMSYCGFLIFQGKLNWGLSIIIASAGAILGITISYFVGETLGIRFFRKYGRYVHLGPEKLDKTSIWFEQYGNRLLVVAYFIPGVRHITGYFSGITKISFSRFAISAYSGAFLWTSTFISLGKVLGANWRTFHGTVKKYSIIGGIILVVIIASIYLYKNYRSRIINYIVEMLNYTVKVFHSLGRIKIFVASIAVVFLVLNFLVIGLIQDFLANEFKDFDAIATLLVKSIFGKEWYKIMKTLSLVSSSIVIILLSLLIFSWILIKGKNKLLECKFLISVVLGGEIIEEILRRIFHRVGPIEGTLMGKINYTFPSEHAFLAIVIYGFAVYMIARHMKSNWIKQIIVIIALIACSFVGISSIFLKIQYPSDVVAGYVFGGVWLALNIILLEVFRILPKVKINAESALSDTDSSKK